VRITLSSNQRVYDSILWIAADDGDSESYFRSPVLALLEETGALGAVLQGAEDYHVPNCEGVEGNFEFLRPGGRGIRTRCKRESVRGPQNALKNESPNLKMSELHDANTCVR
jgi:hypothetical protein